MFIKSIFFKKPYCHVCKQKKEQLLRIHQIGVENIQKTGEAIEPDALFDFLICPVCGDVKVDPVTIDLTLRPGLYANYNSRFEGQEEFG